MAKFLVESPHTAEECSAAGPMFAKHPRAKEILDNTVWRCGYGEHVSYTFADFDSEREAKEVVPEPLRSKLVVKPVDVYSYDEMMKAH
ncbi:MAG: hypothetical protein ACRD1T_09095 [Acidimicrobiia bacterium]